MPPLAFRPQPLTSHRANASVDKSDPFSTVQDWLFGWWIRIAWWTPEGQATRAYYRYSDRLDRMLFRYGVPRSQRGDAIIGAFLALHRELMARQRIDDVPLFAERFAIRYCGLGHRPEGR